ncbi:putative NADPH2 dehydrogenase chain OYE2 [Rhizoctonia solani]|nr:putative NADPH2 dehydrogenase chain OYE2 [Rhizoctonia solani]
MTPPKLFTPIHVGDMVLPHRVILAPLTRCRVDDNHVHHDIAVEQGGVNNVPGIWNEEQITAWKKVVDAVHKRGSYMFLQLWALGRATDPRILNKGGYLLALATGYTDVAPKELSRAEIQQYVQTFAQAAQNAVHEAGCDGAEIHAANGYLIDQFIQEVCNKRTDEYGGSIKNRSQFALEILEAVVKVVGAKRTGFRFSPWTQYQGMRMKNPILTFAYLVSEVAQGYSALVYLHFVEPVDLGLNGEDDELRDRDVETGAIVSNDFARAIWKPRPFFSAGSFRLDSAFIEAETKVACVAMCWYFISNPDLPERIRHGIPLSPYNRKTFYTPGPKAAEGYTDYPSAGQKR